MNEAAKGSTNCPAAYPSGRGDRYSVALNAALLILEDIDTSPTASQPIRLATVIEHVLDAIYEAERQLRTVQHES
jgi:hypothetical protein